MPIFSIAKRGSLFIAALTISLSFTQSLSFGHSWMAPKDAAEQKNPIASSQESIDQGRNIYAVFCSQCHGPNAAGMEKETTGLKTPTPNLVKRLATHTEGDFHWKILEGKGEMPSFREELSDDEIWHLLNYLKSVPNE